MHGNGKQMDDEELLVQEEQATMHGNVEQQEEEEVELMVAEKAAELVKLSPPHQPLNRNAWFICGPDMPYFPSDHKVPTYFHLKVNNTSWTSSPSWWESWVDKLRPIYGHMWRKSGIYDAIESSLYCVKKVHATILGISGFWCSKTNTFVFPWGEATVTLEDALVLGGFSVIGEPLTTVLDNELEELVRRVNEVRRSFNKPPSKKANYKQWMEYFVDRGGDEFEHIGFLTLWLSRWVFAKLNLTVTQQVIPIAVRLAQGVRIALAPAVLAALYSNLTMIKNSLVNYRYDDELVVRPPFQILQVWIWEHFAELRPKKNTEADESKPWVAKWHDVLKKMDISFVISVLECPDMFCWRHYEFGLQDWCFQDRKWMHGTESRDSSLQTLAQFLNPSMLVGVDGVEHYLPHRVAMQFGLDQDVPSFVRRVDKSLEAAWETYDLSLEDFVFDLELPKRRLEPGVTMEYLKWWKQNIHSVTTYKIKGVKRHKHSSKKDGKPANLTIVGEMKKRRKLKRITDLLLHLNKKRKLEVQLDDVPLSARLTVLKEHKDNMKRRRKHRKTNLLLHLNKKRKLKLDEVPLSAHLTVLKEHKDNMKKRGKHGKTPFKAGFAKEQHTEKENVHGELKIGKKPEVVEQKTKSLRETTQNRLEQTTEAHLTDLGNNEELTIEKFRRMMAENSAFNRTANITQLTVKHHKNLELEVKQKKGISPIIEPESDFQKVEYEIEEGEIIETSEDIEEDDSFELGSDPKDVDSLDKFSGVAELSLSSKQLQSQVQHEKTYQDIEEGEMVEVTEVEDDQEVWENNSKDVNIFGKIGKAVVVDVGKTSPGEIQLENFTERNLSYKLGLESSEDKYGETSVVKSANGNAGEMEYVAAQLIDSVIDDDTDNRIQEELKDENYENDGHEVGLRNMSTDSGEPASENIVNAVLPRLPSTHSSNDNSMQDRERRQAARELDMQNIQKLKEEIAAMDVLLKIKRPI